jgi:site-specific DNA-cytosine methylase
MVSLNYETRKKSKLDDRTLEGEKKLRREDGGLFGMQRKKKNRYSPQERKLARQQIKKFSGNVSELSLQTSSSNKNMQTEKLQSENEKIRILRKTQSEIQKNGQPFNQCEGQIIRKLTCVECERLMTLPDDYTKGISNSQRYKCLGNGFVVEVVAHILRQLK